MSKSPKKTNESIKFHELGYVGGAIGDMWMRKHCSLKVDKENGNHSSIIDVNEERKIVQAMSESIASPATLNVSSTSNPANTNAFHAITTRAEVTSYV